MNAWLSPSQLDLLRETPEPAHDRLCGMLVITSHPHRSDQTLPAFVGLGIPTADLSNWVRLIPVPELLGLYHATDAAARAPTEAPIEVKDVAVPRLKKRPDAS